MKPTAEPFTPSIAIAPWMRIPIFYMASRQVWRPVWNGTRMEWIIIKPRYFTAHDLALELGWNVKSWNVHLIDLIETGYVTRKWYRSGRFNDIRAHRVKQSFHWKPNGREDVTTRRKRPCFWQYTPTEHGLIRYLDEYGPSEVNMTEEPGRVTIRPIQKREFERVIHGRIRRERKT